MFFSFPETETPLKVVQMIVRYAFDAPNPITYFLVSLIDGFLLNATAIVKILQIAEKTYQEQQQRHQ